ncbi:unnamed protein product [Nesidiocoris tenuis]|uniref:Uncharacterized protein n=1 Tax=Nesidiocoris tenuis TaxID=355587 RepID=A0A6H5GZ50_9HEMI|nr:unnamed protein product [Nesidiocoris tenuis]
MACFKIGIAFFDICDHCSHQISKFVFSHRMSQNKIISWCCSAEKSQISFYRQIGPCGLVLYFEASDDTLVERLLKRALSSGRQDDNEETIKKRLNTFHTHNDPIVQKYAAKTKKISAEDTPENIFAQVVEAIDALIK